MKFRGINKVTHKWAYGELFQSQGQTFIGEESTGYVVEVERGSVGKTNGKSDESGNEIYIDMFPDN